MNIDNGGNNEHVQKFDEIVLTWQWWFTTLGYFISIISAPTQIIIWLGYKIMNQIPTSIRWQLIWNGINPTYKLVVVTLSHWPTTFQSINFHAIFGTSWVSNNTNHYSARVNISTYHLANHNDYWSRWKIISSTKYNIFKKKYKSWNYNMFLLSTNGTSIQTPPLYWW